MGRFVSLGRNCPICNGSRDDCRKNTSNELIHCRCDDVSSVLGYRFTKLDSEGFGMWAEDDGKNRNDFDWEAVSQSRKAQEEKRRREEQQRHSQSLTAEEREREIRKIHQQLGLSDKHRQNLRDRGLTDDQIDKGKFFTITPWAKVEGIDSRLAGLDFWGRSINSAHHGIACPIWDEVGQIIGFQIRLDNVSNGGKYRWATSRSKRSPNGSSAHMPNSELPISCCRPLGDVTSSESIGLAEGFLKPYVASQKLGQVVLGAAGGNFGTSPKQLKSYLESLSTELGTKIVDLYPDAGSVLNKHVLLQYKRTANLIQSWGYEVRIAWWGQASKETGKDIDEIEFGAGEGFTFSETRIEYLTPEQFFELAEKEQYWDKVFKAQKKLNTLTYTPNILLDQEYLPHDLWKLIPSTGIINLKARKGGGKSTQIKELIKYHRSQGRRIISITPRIALGREQACKWEIGWIDDIGVEGNFSLTTGLLGQEEALGLCWDSLWKMTGRDWSGAVVILDESELGLKHLAASSTCQERRSFIMTEFSKLIDQVLSTNGLVILSDADMTDVSVNYVKALAPASTSIFTVVNKHKGKPWNIEFYTDKRGDVEQDIFDCLASGEKVAIATDSQREAEALERTIIEQYPDKIIVRIDRKVCAEKWGKDFVQTPNESIESIKPDVLIYTPSMGTGVSIDVKHFDKVFGMFFAVIEPTEACQMLARIRDASIPRTLWSKDFNNDIAGCKSFFPEVVAKQLLGHHESGTILLGIAQQLASGNSEDVALLEKLNQLFDKDKGTWNSPHAQLFANIKARKNFGLSQFSIQLHQQLLDDGHKVRVYSGEKTVVGDEIAEAKEDLKQEEAAAIASAEVIDIERAKHILNSPNSTEDDRYKARRAVLADKLPGVELSPEFVFKSLVDDHGRWLHQVQMAWMLANPDKTGMLDRKTWRWHLAKEQAFLPDVKTYSLQVDVLRSLGIDQFLDPELEFSAKDETVKSFMKKAFKMRHKVKTTFDLTVSKKTDAIKFIGKLLDRIGLGLAMTRREYAGENETRFYALGKESFHDPDRQAVLQALSLKYENLSEDLAAESDRQDSPICLNIKASPAGKNQTPQPAPDIDYSHSKLEKTDQKLSAQNPTKTNILLAEENTQSGLSSTPLERGAGEHLAAGVRGQGDVIADDGWQRVEVNIMGWWHSGYLRNLITGRWLSPYGEVPIVTPQTWRAA